MKGRPTKFLMLALVTLLVAAGGIASMARAQSSVPQALFAHDNDKHNLIKIDTSTGLATVVGPTGFDSGASGMAAARAAVPGPGGLPFSAGTLFGAFRDNVLDTDFIVTMDVKTGNATKVVQTSRLLSSGRGIAFGPDGATLFVVEGPSGDLSTIDTTTGAVTLVGNTGFAAASLEWNPDSGTFFSLTADNTLISISPADASAMVIGAVGSLGPTTDFRASTLVRSPAGIWYTVNVLTGDLVTIDVTTGTVAGSVGNLGPPAMAPDGRFLIGATVFAAEELADLAVTKTDNPDPAAAGTGLTYTLTVSNNGPSDATGVTLADTLPTEVSFSSATASQGSCTEAGGTVTCDIGNLAAGNSATVEIVVALDASLADGTTLTNTAQVAGNEPDPNLANNTATEETQVIRQADLGVTKTDQPDPVDGGTVLTYTLSVSNLGPSLAEAVQVIDTLPAGSSFESASGDGWACSGAGETVTCTRPELPVGDAPPITVTVIAPTPEVDTDVTNTVSVSSATEDPNPDNNTDSEITRVRVIVPPPGRDKLTAQVFIDFACDGYFQGRLDIPLAGVPVKVIFLFNGTSVTRVTGRSGMVSFTGYDVSDGVTISVSLPADYHGFPLEACFNSPTSVTLYTSDFNGRTIRHKHVDFRATVAD